MTHEKFKEIIEEKREALGTETIYELFAFLDERITKLEETRVPRMTEDEIQYIQEWVKESFEIGLPMDDTDEIARVCKDDGYGEHSDLMAEYYLDLVGLGPVGFYNEFKEQFKWTWDPDFVAEFGDDKVEDTKDE